MSPLRGEKPPKSLLTNFWNFRVSMTNLSPIMAKFVWQPALTLYSTKANFTLIGWRNCIQTLKISWKSLKGYVYTVSQKKVPTFKLSVTLSNLNRLSKFLHCWNAHEILLQNTYDNTHLTLSMLLHYLGKLKIQIFCRCRSKRKQIAF